jgi:hypothetical protein
MVSVKIGNAVLSAKRIPHAVLPVKCLVEVER